MSIHDLVYAERMAIRHWALGICSAARDEYGVVVFVLDATGFRILSDWYSNGTVPTHFSISGRASNSLLLVDSILWDWCRAHHRTNGLIMVIN